MPENPDYWAYIFPAMIATTVGVDIMYSVSNIFITTSVPRRRQGLAGALINCLVFLGISVFLGLADIAVTATAHLGQKESYKVACWFAVGCAGVSLLLLACFVKIDKAKSDLTADEKAELEAEIRITGVPLPPAQTNDWIQPIPPRSRSYVLCTNVRRNNGYFDICSAFSALLLFSWRHPAPKVLPRSFYLSLLLFPLPSY